MVDREGAQHMSSEGKQVDRSQRPAQECSMCGDVGFADQLHRCMLCRFRHQHTYVFERHLDAQLITDTHSSSDGKRST